MWIWTFNPWIMLGLFLLFVLIVIVFLVADREPPKNDLPRRR